MAGEEKNSIDLENAELKMPEENFLEIEPESKKSSIWVKLLWTLITLLVLGGILGTMWWFKDEILKRLLPPIPSVNQELNTATTTEPAAPEVKVGTKPEIKLSDLEIELQKINQVSESDEIGAIELDLVNTNVNGLIEEFKTVEDVLTPPSS